MRWWETFGNKRYGSTVITDTSIILAGVVSFIVTLVIVWDIGGNELLTINVVISLFLGFLAFFTTLFFINRGRVLEIKETYYQMPGFGHAFRLMAILLRNVKENLDNASKKKSYVFTSCLEKQGMLPKHTKFVSELSNFLKPREHLQKI